MDLYQLPENRDRTDTPPCKEPPELSPSLIWIGLAQAIRQGYPFMGKTHTWWKEFVAEKAAELSLSFDDFKYDTEVKDYEKHTPFKYPFRRL